MRQLILGVGLGLLATSALATNGLYMPAGTGMTAGSASNAKLGTATFYNPAATYQSTSRVRAGLFGVGVGVELGGLGDLYGATEALQTELDDVQTALSDNDAQAALDAVDQLEQVLNQELDTLSDTFYIQPEVNAALPLTPLQIRSERLGTFSLLMSSYSAGNLELLHEEATINIDVADLSDENLDPLDFLRTTSSVYVKSGQMFNVGLGYARPVYDLEQFNSQVVAGARATLVAHSLRKNLYPIKEFLSAATSGNSGDMDALLSKLQSDASETVGEFSYNLALDLGVTVNHERGHLGATLYNLNAPAYAYNVLGGNCAGLATQAEQTECYHAEYFAALGDIALAEEHVMNPLLTLDGSFSFRNNQVALVGAADLWGVNDLFGREKQMLSAALLLQPNFFAIPSARFGLQKNLADTSYTHYNFGLSLFKVFYVDTSLAMNLGDALSGDNEAMASALRGASITTGFELSF